MPLNNENTFILLDKVEGDELIQLVYASCLTCKSRFTPTVFKAIHREAREYNQLNGITGILCYGNGRFFQCLEGEKNILLPLVKGIFDDNRHKHIKVLMIQPIQHRDFSYWGMRLMFLERWLWSPETKKQAEALSKFLPFEPDTWSLNTTEEFLNAIQNIVTPPHVRESGITFNAFGNMIKHVAGPHQAFLVVQGILSILVIVTITLMYYYHLS